jgi:hypothetical protein
MKKTTLLLAAGLLAGCGAAANPSLMAGDEAGRTARSDDRIEIARALKRGALERDGAACRDWLLRVGGKDVTLSQRADARLTVAALLAAGPVSDRDGRDLSADLHYQLAWSWTTCEPRSAAKAARHAEAYRRCGGRTEIPASSAGDAMFRGNVVNGLVEEEGTVWGGGHDRLYLNTGLLAFVTDERGLPTFRGTHLRALNAGEGTVFLTAQSAGEFHRALKPGEEILRPIDLSAVGTGRFTTGIPVTVRLGRPSTSVLAVGR